MIVHKYEELDSTNDYLRRKLDLQDYECVIAENQTKGKGKRGNIWVSSKGAALFSFSVPNDKDEFLEKVTIFTGYIVREVIKKYIDEENQKYLTFKWPNDIYYKNRKICGILCEVIRNHIIVGVGINVNNTDFGIYKDIAISLLEITGKKHNVDTIISQITDLFIAKENRINIEWEQILQNINKFNYLKNKIIKKKFDGVVDETEYEFVRIDRKGQLTLLGDKMNEVSFVSLDFVVL